MASRNTQTSRIIVQAEAPNSARATQVSRVVVQAEAPNSARVTQLSRIIIATIPLSSGGRPQRGVGA
jgi:hypothetical protein